MNTNNIHNPLENASRSIFDILRVHNNNEKMAYEINVKNAMRNAVPAMDQPNEKTLSQITRLFNGVVREGIKRGEIIKLGRTCYDFTVWYWRYQAKINADMVDMVEPELEPIFMELMATANHNAQNAYTAWMQFGFFDTKEKESEVETDDVQPTEPLYEGTSLEEHPENIGKPARRSRKSRVDDGTGSDENVQSETSENGD